MNVGAVRSEQASKCLEEFRRYEREAGRGTMIGRREFLKRSGKATLAFSGALTLGELLSACAPWKSQFSKVKISTFGFKLYNGPNPNLKWRMRQIFTFKTKMDTGNDWPGPAFYLSAKTPIFAAAPGIVSKIKPIDPKTSNVGGFRLCIAYHPYRVCYDHVAEPKVKIAQNVQRGDLIAAGVSDYRFDGSIGRPAYFKIMLYDIENIEDPDNYGINHSYMNYLDQIIEPDIQKSGERGGKQHKLFSVIINSFKPRVDSKGKKINPLSILHNMSHRESGYYNTYYWSNIEKFRFLEFIYNKNPSDFSMSKNDFQRIKKDFYDNQPIILTLPFRNPKPRK